MSCNRENVIWKSRDGSWSRGFFEFYQTGDDHEWDVEYDHSRFNWVSVGHTTEEEAEASWKGSNPGGHDSEDHPNERTDAYDAMAMDYIRACEESEHEAWRNRTSHLRY